MSHISEQLFKNTNSIVVIVALRNLVIFVLGGWFFEVYLDYTLPGEDNLLLFFVAIPIIWSTLAQLWTSYSYHDVQSGWINVLSHVSSVLIVASTVFIISVILNTLATILDPVGTACFYIVGWTVLLGMTVCDLIDAAPHDPEMIVEGRAGTEGTEGTGGTR